MHWNWRGARNGFPASRLSRHLNWLLAKSATVLLTGKQAGNKVRLGLFAPSPPQLREKRKKLRPAATITVDLLHRAVPAVKTRGGFLPQVLRQRLQCDGAQLRDGADTQTVEDFLCLTSKAA